jgi:hypothetical protein
MLSLNRHGLDITFSIRSTFMPRGAIWPLLLNLCADIGNTMSIDSSFLCVTYDI